MEETLGSRLQQLVLIADAYEALRFVRPSGKIEGELEAYTRAREVLAMRLRTGLNAALSEVKP